MRAQHRIDLLPGKCRHDTFRGQDTIQIFEQFFTRLRKRCLQKRLKTGIIQCGVLVNLKYRRRDFGRRDKCFGRNLKTYPGTPDTA